MSDEAARIATLMMAAVGRARFYGAEHSLTLGTIDLLLAALAPVLAEQRQLQLAVTGDELYTETGRVEHGRSVAALVERLTEKGVGLVELHRGLDREEVAQFCAQLADPMAAAVTSQTHLLVGTAMLKAGGAVTDAVRAESAGLATSDRISDEALQMKQLEAAVREHQHVRVRDAREIVFGLLSHLAHQENVFLNLAEVHGRHRGTYVHSCNVATLAMSFALSLGIGGEDAFEIGAAALLHDIGKTVVPVEILDKPGKLDDAEWEIVRRHPVAGARLLLRQRDVPRLAVVVAYEHHRGYAGGGYPEAPFAPALQSQLVSVVDTFDAILDRRRGAAPGDVFHALAQLQAERGRRLAPQLVDAFRGFVLEQLAAGA